MSVFTISFAIHGPLHDIAMMTHQSSQKKPHSNLHCVFCRNYFDDLSFSSDVSFWNVYMIFIY